MAGIPEGQEFHALNIISTVHSAISFQAGRCADESQGKRCGSQNLTLKYRAIVKIGDGEY